MKSTISSHTGPAASSTSTKTPTNSAANTVSAARPAVPAAAHHRRHRRVEPEREHGGEEDRDQRAEREQRERHDPAEGAQLEQRAHRHGDLDALRGGCCAAASLSAPLVIVRRIIAAARTLPTGDAALERGDAVADQLRADHEREHGHDRRVVAAHPVPHAAEDVGGAVNESIVFIHDGSFGTSSPRGRLRHMRAARPSSSTPRISFKMPTQVAGSPPWLASAPLEATSTIVPRPRARRSSRPRTRGRSCARRGGEHQHDGDDRHRAQRDPDRKRQDRADGLLHVRRRASPRRRGPR